MECITAPTYNYFVRSIGETHVTTLTCRAYDNYGDESLELIHEVATRRSLYNICRKDASNNLFG